MSPAPGATAWPRLAHFANSSACFGGSRVESSKGTWALPGVLALTWVCVCAPACVCLGGAHRGRVHMALPWLSRLCGPLVPVKVQVPWWLWPSRGGGGQPSWAAAAGVLFPCVLKECLESSRPREVPSRKDPMVSCRGRPGRGARPRVWVGRQNRRLTPCGALPPAPFSAGMAGAWRPTYLPLERPVCRGCRLGMAVSRTQAGLEPAQAVSTSSEAGGSVPSCREGQSRRWQLAELYIGLGGKVCSAQLNLGLITSKGRDLSCPPSPGDDTRLLAPCVQPWSESTVG